LIGCSMRNLTKKKTMMRMSRIEQPAQPVL
jgi:hypothetical protein